VEGKLLDWIKRQAQSGTWGGHPEIAGMECIRKHRSWFIFLGFLGLCSLLVAVQFRQNRTRHVELREAFILLHSRGYTAESERLYQRLLGELKNLPDSVLLEDFQRTLTLVEPGRQDPENLIWRYHWTVSNELEKRSAVSLQKALKLAREK